MTDKFCIVIDAGHGGAKETGATSGGYVEKDLNLKVAKLIENKLQKYFTNVYMTRTSDVKVSLNDRGSFVSKKANEFNGKTICLSVHFNAYNGEARGTETIYSIFSTPTLAESILKAITKLGLPKRRVFKKKSSRGNVDWYAMHRLTGKAQTIIVEPLFLDNLEDRKILGQDGFLDKLANAYVEGLLNYLNIKIEDNVDVEVENRVEDKIEDKTEDKIKIVNIDEALKVLVDNKIISSPDYWKKVASIVKYFDTFVLNIANKLK